MNCRIQATFSQVSSVGDKEPKLSPSPEPGQQHSALHRDLSFYLGKTRT